MSEEAQKDVNFFLEAIGTGPAQLHVALLCGILFFCYGAEVLALSVINSTLGSAWYSPVGRGMLMSATLLGFAAGGISVGALADRYGRKSPNLALGGIIVGNGASMFAPNYWHMLGTRAFVGFSMGWGIPSWLSLASELSPIAARAPLQAAGALFSVFGGVYVCVCVILLDPHMHIEWRRLLLLATIPPLVTLLPAAMLLPESPRWAFLHGQTDRARRILLKMARQNGKRISALEDERAEWAAPEEDTRGGPTAYMVIFSRKYSFTTAILCYSTLACNLCMYGLTYSLPQCLPEMEKASNVAEGWQLLIGEAVSSLNAILVLYADVMPRILSQFCSLLVTSAALLLFALFLFFRHAGATFAVVAAKFAGRCAFNFTYFYTAELYPTSCRASGVGLAISFGRIGGIISPLLFEWLVAAVEDHPVVQKHPGGKFSAYFLLMAVCLLVDALLVLCLPFETRLQALEETYVDVRLDKRFRVPRLGRRFSNLDKMVDDWQYAWRRSSSMPPVSLPYARVGTGGHLDRRSSLPVALDARRVEGYRTCGE
ncbi:unnamed protein product [Vitrella brassicaformis CCMP3155]|uniref:Major facilitator superfamily (MFS) profile domain-containing protein n=1 Tax=Vitrella brassicaformis (strain CCMP3155) TaxID=1169540 RepID=A0A0G4EK98_VITBC|nr:unnamed protein product [Vitrella brassicaformis CCMP3155]|eukprot:CEL96985.1 unnamed protein product [Vitrella brassicaformis CCMP3155]